MQTRSKRNLQNVSIKDILLEPVETASPHAQAPPPHAQAPAAYAQAPAAYAPPPRAQAHSSELIKSQAALIAEQRILITQLRNELETNNHMMKRMLVLDTESFNFQIDGRDTLLPLQLAWGIYQWDDNTHTLMEIKQETLYISELMCQSKYRHAVKALSKRCFRRHEEKMSEKNFPLMTAFQALERLQQDIVSLAVDTVVGYNISWDFAAISQLVGTFLPVSGVPRQMTGCPTIDSYDSTTENPFHPLGLHYLDLMHEVVKKYGTDLVLHGIADGTIHRAPGSNQLMLKGNNPRNKSIFSAEYVLQYFFGVQQNHMADDDVRYEAWLLERCIRDFGMSSLERNILYPQKSCFQKILHIAHAHFEDDKSSPPQVRQPSQQCMFMEDSNDGQA